MNQNKLIIIVIITLTILIPIQAANTIPSGYQSFYVLGNSIMIVMEAVDEAFGLDTSEALPFSIFSVVSYQDSTGS